MASLFVLAAVPPLIVGLPGAQPLGPEILDPQNWDPVHVHTPRVVPPQPSNRTRASPMHDAALKKLPPDSKGGRHKRTGDPPAGGCELHCTADGCTCDKDGWKLGDAGAEDESVLQAMYYARSFLEDDVRSEEAWGRFATALHAAPTLQPRMVTSFPCSGSTAVISIAIELLSQHGFPLSLPGWDISREYLQCSHQGRVCRQDTEQGTEDGLRVLVAKGAGEGKSLFVKGMGSPNAPWEAVRAMGTRTGIARRGNDLAHLVCMARDCFDHMLATQLQGVALRVGPNAEACLKQRRHLPRDQQTLVRIDTSLLVESLQNLRESNAVGIAQTLVDAGWAADSFETVTTEDLFSFEPTTDAAAFETSVRAWTTLLRSLDVTPVDETVRATLQKTRGKHEIDPLRYAIQNLDEVAEVLRQAGHPYDTMLDEADASRDE